MCCKWIHSEIGVRVAETLLKYGANTDPEHTSIHNYSPLMEIIVHNHTKYAINMVTLLLRYGAHADATVQNNTIFTLIEKYQPSENKNTLNRTLLSYCKNMTGTIRSSAIT